MKFAIINGIKTEATKEAKGICPICNSELIAKCGDRKMNHWSHKAIRNCDPWWEPETEWHRSWKNNFSQDWQEILLLDKNTNEKHIADIRTKHGLVIEFQHSPISSEESTSREKFYKTMFWVVDGARRKNDYSRFLKTQFRRLGQTIFSIDCPEICLPVAWLDSSVNVVFDFKGNETMLARKDIRNDIFCLIPKKEGSPRILVQLSRQDFIKNAISGELLLVFKQ
jgi:competence protein CoiA